MAGHVYPFAVAREKDVSALSYLHYFCPAVVVAKHGVR
jgi:hypothetical protein